MKFLRAQRTLVLTDSADFKNNRAASRRKRRAWASRCWCCVAQNAPTTERPEAVEAGTARVVGTEREAIVRGTAALLENATAYAQMAQAVNPFGDGKAAEWIIAVLHS